MNPSTPLIQVGVTGDDGGQGLTTTMLFDPFKLTQLTAQEFMSSRPNHIPMSLEYPGIRLPCCRDSYWLRVRPPPLSQLYTQLDIPCSMWGSIHPASKDQAPSSHGAEASVSQAETSRTPQPLALREHVGSY